MFYKFIIFVKMKYLVKFYLEIWKFVCEFINMWTLFVCSISLRKLSHWIVQMPLINCNFLQFFAKTCGCLQTTLSTRLIRKLNGPENTVSVKRTYQASTIKFWFLKSMQQRGHSITTWTYFCSFLVPLSTFVSFFYP